MKIVVRHPVAAYFIFAFVGTWGLLAPIVLSEDGLGYWPVTLPLPAYAALFILSTFAGPFAAAFVLTRIVDGPEGVRALRRRLFQVRMNPLWLVLAIGLVPLLQLGVAAAVIGFDAVRDALAAGWQKALFTFVPALAIFPALITWGEEPGWRGFALTRLQRSVSPLHAALVVGFFHALWHLPVFVVHGGPVALGPFNPAAFALNTAGIMLLTIVWSWVFNNARQSVFVAVMLHASTNAGLGAIAQILPHDAVREVSHAVVFAYGALAVLVLIATRGQLGYRAARS